MARYRRTFFQDGVPTGLHELLSPIFPLAHDDCGPQSSKLGESQWMLGVTQSGNLCNRRRMQKASGADSLRRRSHRSEDRIPLRVEINADVEGRWIDPAARRQGAGHHKSLLAKVPELTRSAGVNLNARVSLRAASKILLSS
jgi:hypothetical protein